MSMAQRNCDFIKTIATSHGHMNARDTLASSYGPQNSPRANSPLGAHVHTLGFERVEGTVGGGVVKGTSCKKSFSFFLVKGTSCQTSFYLFFLVKGTVCQTSFSFIYFFLCKALFVKRPLCRHFIL